MRSMFVTAWLLAVVLAGSAGCKPLGVLPTTSWLGRDDAKKVGTPASVTAVWSNAVLDRADGSRARGFGGRLMFYRPEGESPIRVDGSLVVYAFDEEHRNPQDPRPDRKYMFTREQFTSHYSKSQLGDSYSVWVPWDDVGGPTRQVSLIVRFTPAEGSSVVSDPTRLTLEGTDVPPPADDPAYSPSRPGAPESPLASLQSDAADGPQRMATTTIALPPPGKQ